eukprot:525112-Rhodomonas_salina.2
MRYTEGQVVAPTLMLLGSVELPKLLPLTVILKPPPGTPTVSVTTDTTGASYENASTKGFDACESTVTWAAWLSPAPGAIAHLRERCETSTVVEVHSVEPTKMLTRLALTAAAFPKFEPKIVIEKAPMASPFAGSRAVRTGDDDVPSMVTETVALTPVPSATTTSTDVVVSEFVTTDADVEPIVAVAGLPKLTPAMVNVKLPLVGPVGGVRV